MFKYLIILLVAIFIILSIKGLLPRIKIDLFIIIFWKIIFVFFFAVILFFFY